MTRCGHDGCAHAAVCVPKLNVPATGYAIGQHEHLKMILNAPCCDEHFRDFRANDLLSDELREVFRIVARASAGDTAAAPDFDRAWISRVSLTSSEYRLFAKARAQRKSAEPPAVA